MVRGADGGGGRGSPRGLRVRDGQLLRAATGVRPPHRLPRDQLAPDGRAPGGARVPQRGRGLRLLAGHLRVCEGRRGDPAPGWRAADGPHPQARHRGLHERLQHLYQVGGDLGADVRRPDPRSGHSGLPSGRRPDVAWRPGLRERPPLRRRADQGVDPGAGEGLRHQVRHRQAARDDDARELHEPLVEARAGAQSEPTVAVQRPVRRHHLPRRCERLQGNRGGRRLFRGPGRGDGVQGRQGYRDAHRRAVSAHLRGRAVLPHLPPLHRAVHGAGRHVRQLHLPLVRLRRIQPRIPVRSRRSDREPGRGRAGQRARRHGQHVLPDEDPVRHDRRLRGARHRVPPDQELPHRLHRPRGQPPGIDG